MDVLDFLIPQGTTLRLAQGCTCYWLLVLECFGNGELIMFLINDEERIRLEEALDPQTPPETLDRLANDKSSSVRGCVAYNPNTSPETLALLADDEDMWIRRRVARNPNTPPEVLSRLANDKDYYARLGVAQNPNTPPETITRLADDESRYVHYSVKTNPNTPQYIKDYLNALRFMEDQN